MNYPENTPQWLKDAEISADAEFRIDVYNWGNVVVWLKGSFNGVWLDGEWRGGVWHGGEWRGGVWHGGEWRGGVWHGGEWRDGVWLDGEWRGGEWRGGVWLDGEWRGGEWRGGETACRSKYIPVITVEGKIRIGCKVMTIKEWDKWFKGKEEFQTKRDTLEFKMIYAHYLAVKTYAKTMGENKCKTKGL